MGEIITIIEFFALFGSMIMGAFLIISWIFRFIRPNEYREKRLNILTGAAAVLFCLGFGVHYIRKNEIELEAVLSDLPDIKEGIGVLMLIPVIVSIMFLLVIIIACIYKGFHTIIFGKGELSERIKKPIVILAIVLGICSLFLTFPFLIGEHPNKDPVKIWGDGVCEIVKFFGVEEKQDENNGTTSRLSPVEKTTNNAISTEQKKDDTEGFSASMLFTYLMFYVIMLGIIFMGIRILYSIAKRTLQRNGETDFINEYSNSIGLLLVGIALLRGFRNDGFLTGDDVSKTIIELVKSFAEVVVIVALTILILEIIRLLMDMRQKLIYKEARYLFIFLIGHGALLILAVLNFLFDTINTVFGDIYNNNIGQIQEKLRKKMIDAIAEEINEIGESIGFARRFSPFDERVTKK